MDRDRKKAVNDHRSGILREKKSETAFKKARRHFKSKKKHFMCPMQLRNRLPEPSPGPKLLQLPSDLASFVEFRPTSLDREYKWKHHCERTLGVSIDLVDLETHVPPSEESRPPMHADDDRLLKWDASNTGATAAEGQNSDKSFFRKTQFMQNSSSHSMQKKSSSSAGRNKRTADDERSEEDATLSTLINSFAAAAKKDAQAQKTGDAEEEKTGEEEEGVSSASGKRAKMKHPTKPGVFAEWCLPVLPAASLWANNYRHVTFDDDPGSGGFMAKLAGMGPSELRTRVEAGLIVNAKNEYQARLQDKVLTGSLILPASVPNEEEDKDGASFHWQRQYQMWQEKGARPEDRGNYLLFVDEAGGAVTYKEVPAQKLELRHGISANKSQRDEELDSYTVARRSMTGAERRHRRLLSRVVDEDVLEEEEDLEEEDVEEVVEEEGGEGGAGEAAKEEDGVVADDEDDGLDDDDDDDDEKEVAAAAAEKEDTGKAEESEEVVESGGDPGSDGGDGKGAAEAASKGAEEQAMEDDAKDDEKEEAAGEEAAVAGAGDGGDRMQEDSDGLSDA